jgi:transcriptional regulator with XRE-family HTH domain
MGKQLNAALRQARLSKLWTIEQAAERVGVSKSTYLRWENSAQMPHLSSLARLCDTFSVTPETLGYGDLLWSGTKLSSQVQEEQPPQNHEQKGNTDWEEPPHRSGQKEEQSQTLFRAVKSLLPTQVHPHLHLMRMQMSQKTLHVSCDVSLDNNVLKEVKHRFREMTGWTLGIQAERLQHVAGQEEEQSQALIRTAKGLLPAHVHLLLVKIQPMQRTLHVSCNGSLDKNLLGEIKRRFREMTGWTLGIQEIPSKGG